MHSPTTTSAGVLAGYVVTPRWGNRISGESLCRFSSLSEHKIIDPRATHQRDHGGTVKGQLAGADPSDGDKILGARRPPLGDRAERGVGEHDVGRDLLRLGDPGPPVAQSLMELLVAIGRAGRAAAELALGAVDQAGAAHPA